jgi:protein-S-isoprenylcysteine O-methyltransferase Ste14
MNPRVEDLIGKALMLTAFTVLAGRTALSLLTMLAMTPRPPLWPLLAASQFLSLFFVALVLLMTIRRLPPSSSAAGLEPRVTAIVGTFALLALVWLPPGRIGLGVQLAATTLLFIGTAASIYCLHFLGRSFSIMASARNLVTKGPYGIVRHPLYLTEGLSTLAIIVLHWSLAALVIGIVQTVMQFRRMHNEETVLRQAFPEYADYAQRVPMIVPGTAR